jgi:REP element-mobilizing transposase RayT
VAGVDATGYNGGVHKHLRRLERVWIDQPIYFVTTCSHLRKPILASEPLVQVLIKEWQDARERHGWAIGRYVIMPDHVHFFCAAELDAKPLSIFIGFWKEWTSKEIKRLANKPDSIWQDQFFDHVVRSSESYGQKWDYVRENPVRAGLVADANDWPWQGEVDELRL